MALRGFLVDGRPDVAAKSFKEGVKNYPLAQAKNRGDGVHQHLEETDEHDPCEQLRVLEEIAHVIQKEPVDCRRATSQPWWSHEPRRPALTLPGPN